MVRSQKEGKLLKVSLVSLLVGAVLYIITGMLSKAIPGISSFFTGLFGDGLRDTMINFYVSQLSLTFITITVTSSLSDTGNMIYWENIAEKKLITPTWTCFLAYTAYSFVTIVFSTVAVFPGRFNAPAFFLFFFLDIISLMLLTINMVDVYYNREEKKRNLRKKFIECAEEVRRRNRDKTLSGASCLQDYQDMKLGMRQQTIQAVESNDFKILRENLMFIAENIDYFQVLDDGVHDTGNIDYIFACLNENTMSIVNECIRVILNNRKDSDWRTVHKILDGLLDENRINGLVKSLNYYNVGNYLKNLRDASLARALIRRSDSEWIQSKLTDREREQLRSTIGTANEYLDTDVITIADEKESKRLTDAYLDGLKPLFDIARKDSRINYHLGEAMYNVSYNIPGAADRVSELMKLKNIRRTWRISSPGEESNHRYGEVLEFFPGGNGRAYRTISDYEEGNIYSNLTYDNTTGYICVRYLGSGQSVIFLLDGDFLRGDNDDVIYNEMEEV